MLFENEIVVLERIAEIYSFLKFSKSECNDVLQQHHAFGLRKISHNHEFLLCVLEQQFRSQTTKIVVLKQQFCSQNSKSKQRKQKFTAIVVYVILYYINMKNQHLIKTTFYHLHKGPLMNYVNKQGGGESVFSVWDLKIASPFERNLFNIIHATSTHLY